MKYSPSKISNIDVQLLHMYRILRPPSEYASALVKDCVHEVLNFTPQGTSSDDSSLYYYQASTQVTDKIPFLEFTGPEQSRLQLANLVEVDCEQGTVTLVGKFSEFPENLRVDCYWCNSYHDIELLLNEFNADLKDLRKDIDLLVKRLNEISFDGLLNRVTGSEGHLIKFSKSDNRLGIIDSNFYIGDASEALQLTNPSQATLSQLSKSLHNELSITLDNSELFIDQFRGGRLVITGNGTVNLYNVASPVVFRDFSGTVTAQQCNNIRIDSGTRLQSLHIISSTAVQYAGYINKLTLIRASSFTHHGGNMHEITHVGVGCTYGTEIPTYLIPMSEASTPPYSHIQGMFCAYNGDVIKHGREVSFITGQHDDPLPVDIIVYQKDVSNIPPSGSGTEPYPDVVGGVDIPEAYQNLSTAEYRSVAFSQSFMLTGAGPQTVSDITSETFHALRACMNWCCGEFGPSIYGQSYGKLIRTWCMYQQDSSYRGEGKTLYDFVNRLRTQVISWGGSDIWSKSYAELKSETLMTDSYALQFMQMLYNNIRYPQLFGLDASSDSDVYKAMSGMPVTNETINYATGEIPNYNKPVVWLVSKRAVLNDFSGYTGYYVLYRQKAFDSAIKQGVNPAVLAEQRKSTPFDKFFAKTVGKYIDYDGQYGVQCFDLANYYAVELLGASSFIGWHAYEIYTNFYNQPGHDKYDRIENTPSFIPKKGDIIVWSSDLGTHGHVAVCQGEGDTTYFKSYDQNWTGNNDPCTLITHNYNAVLGVLRPKDQTKIWG